VFCLLRHCGLQRDSRSINPPMGCKQPGKVVFVLFILDFSLIEPLTYDIQTERVDIGD
jgi:hypothetical protein